MGMNPTEYWEMSPYLTVAYRKAYRLKREAENEMAWLQGLYVFDAFAVCLANVFAKRGTKKQTYIEKPIDIFPLTGQEKKRREQEEQQKMQQAMEAIARKQRMVNKQKGD
jgi:hypothetical protein